jgi:GT2 family glycosyltransferase
VSQFSAIFVSWNSARDLSRALASLRCAANLTGASVEAIVVDNASSDASAEVASDAGALVIRNTVNAGFATAASQGIAVATGDWCLLLNPDLELDQHFLAAMTQAAIHAAPDVAVLVPRVMYASDRQTLQHAGIAVDEDGFAREIDEGPKTNSVFGASGGAGAFRRDVLSTIGAFEPVFFAYLEDADLAWRLRAAGYTATYVPTALAWHSVSVSLREGSPAKAYLVARNRRLLMRLIDGGSRVRLRRGLTDALHCLFVLAQTRSAAPLTGRLAARRARRYANFISSARRSAGVDPSAVQWLERRPLAAGVRAKRRMIRLGSIAGKHET